MFWIIYISLVCEKQNSLVIKQEFIINDDNDWYIFNANNFIALIRIIF